MQIIRRLTITAASFTYVPGEYIEQFQQKEVTSTMIAIPVTMVAHVFFHSIIEIIASMIENRSSQFAVHHIKSRYDTQMTSHKLVRRSWFMP